MLKQLKIGPRLVAGFGIVIGVFLLAMAGIVFFQNAVVEDAQQIQRESLPYALTADEMVLDVTQVQQFLQDVSATHNRDGLEEAETHAQAFKANLEKFRTMFQRENNPQAVQAMDDLGLEFDEFYTLGKRMAEAYITKGIQAGNALMEDFDKRCDVLNEKLGHLRKTQVDEANDMSTRIVDASTLSRNVVVLAAAFGLLLGALISYVVTRTIVLPVQKMQQAIHDIESTSNYRMRVDSMPPTKSAKWPKPSMPCWRPSKKPLVRSVRW